MCSTLLVAVSFASDGRQRLRTAIHLSLDGAVSPMEEVLSWMISPKVNAEQMNQFRLQVSAA